jgi:glycosyltransferase involved in cell wall biosynthesis
MKIALLTTDNRGPFQELDKEAPWFGMAPEALLSGFASLPELQVHVISCIRQPVKAPQKIADNIWFHSLHVPRIGWMRTGYLGCLRAIRRRLKLIQPDLVHGQGTEAEQAICAAFSGYPNVVTMLGIMSEMAKVVRARPGSFYWFAALLENFALRRTAGVLCNSRYTEEKVRRRAQKTWLVPNALREPFFSTPLPESRPSKCTILNIGSVCALKRQNELLDIAEQLHQEGLQFEIQFLGIASRANGYGERFLDRVQSSSYLSYRGFKSISELIETFDKASALVHVSQIETFGLVVAEALSRNLKFFGFKAGGVTDIASGVDRAELIDDGDWSGLKKAIRHWILNGAPGPASAAAEMRRKYHPSKIAQRHLEIYREIATSCRD